MILLLHVITALTSIGFSTYAFFVPTNARLHLSEALVAGTLISGTWLVVSSRAAILQPCISGVIYLASLSIVLVGTRYKLAKAKQL